MKKNDVCEIVRELVSPIADANGCLLYDLEFVKEGSDYYLRVFLDMKDGERSVSLDECEAVSRALSEALDKADPIGPAYMLEVSSPGLDRSLKKDEHFERFMGSKVDIGLYKAVNGAKVITGTLTGYGNGNITVETNGESVTLAKSETTWVKLSLDGIF